MSKKKQHRSTDASEFQKYLNNEMSGTEANAFERQLLNDSFEADALEGLSMLDNSTLDSDLDSLKTKLKRQTTVFWRLPAFYAAASVVLLFGIISSLWLLVPDERTLVSDSQLTHEHKKEPAPEPEDSFIQKEFIQIEEKEAAIVTEKAIKQKTQASKAESGPTLAKKSSTRATKLQSKSNFQLRDSEAFAIKAPKYDTNTSRVEEEVMTVDYGTLEGESFLGQKGTNSEELKVVKGKVMDRNREPLPGATINVRGTQIAAVADMDGHYQMKVPVKDTSKPLDAFYIGFVSQESDYPKADSINFMLQEDYMALSEVVTVQSSEEEERRIKEFINAEPEGGLEKYISDIETSLRYPASGSGKKEQITALITINIRGEIKNIELRRSPGEAYSVETIRAIRNGADWHPATKKGFPVEDTVKIKLRFIPKGK
ncbi:MAG: carboxypeptidase-like regulatory domain-containing protein [Bacteroidales bacterium]|nr:carboxypeptidase-like regulatory domain-containing protein [Bacteroidales bacterium]